MSGINEEIVAFGTTRLRSTFNDDIGNKKVIEGTGFWITNHEAKLIFITNKHNVDARLKLGLDTKFKLTCFEIELRKTSSHDVWLDETKFFEVWKPLSAIHTSNTADCAVMVNFSWVHRELDFKGQPLTMKTEEIATDKFFKEKLSMMDQVSFVGFPGNQKSNWWNTETNTPIARVAAIASLVSRQFENEHIATNDVVLVSGLSFSGSSGSPVLSMQKSIPLAGGGDHPAYAPPRLIGIMSGHFWDESDTPSMFKHSGLSYFTKTTSILQLLRSIGYWS